MKTIHKVLIVFSIALAYWSCTKESDLTTIPDQLVVEGYLAPGHSIDIKVTKEIRFGSDSTDRSVTGLTVKISDGVKTFLLKDNNDGHYYSKSAEVVEEAKTYSLFFTYQGKDVTSTTTVPSKPQNFTSSVRYITLQPFTSGSFSGGATLPDPVQLKWKNDAQEYHLVVVTNVEASPVLINTNADAPTRPSFRTSPNTASTFDIRPFQFRYYGVHTLVLYKINPEYAGLYDDTGNSSLNLRTPNSNIKNAQGIFTAVNSDTLLLTVRKP